jgi:4-carboxymuconolactone decarboxylase
MSDPTRYERGLAKFKEIYGERASAYLESWREIAPDLGTYIVEYGHTPNCRK